MLANFGHVPARIDVHVGPNDISLPPRLNDESAGDD